ncbi:MAG: ABC transporter permease [Candidatus Heimdallarchaeota archaeon]|nr:ABC transporter permease [Candidatus Heimdallarchaeota archaeon]
MFEYALKSFRETIRNSMSVSLIFLLPLLFTLSMAFMYGDQSINSAAGVDDGMIKIGVVNMDEIVYVEDLIDELETIRNEWKLIGDPLQLGFFSHYQLNTPSIQFQEVSNRDSLIRGIQGREFSLGLIVDHQFSMALIMALSLKINYETGIAPIPYVNHSSEIEVLGDYTNTLFIETNSIFSSTYQAYVNKLLAFESVIKINTNEVNVSSTYYSEFDKYIPGFIIYVLILGVSGSAGILAKERENQTMDLLILSGYPKPRIVVGLSLTQIVISAIQLAIFLVTVYFIGYPGPGSFLRVFILSLGSIFLILGISFITSALIKESNIAMGFPSIIGIPLTFLTGTWVPLPDKPMGNLQVWHLNPFYALSEGVRQILMHDYTFSQILPEILIVIGYSLLFYIFGIYLLKRNIFKQI